jgi:DNA-binding protein YbaB
MFSKLKQFRDLRSQAKTIQDVLAQEVITEEKNGVTIKMNGNMEVMSISLPSGMDKATQESALKGCFNDAVKKAQRLMAKKLQDMGGIPGLTQ